VPDVKGINSYWFYSDDSKTVTFECLKGFNSTQKERNLFCRSVNGKNVWVGSALNCTGNQLMKPKENKCNFT
jgi:hypothetical protein